MKEILLCERRWRAKFKKFLQTIIIKVKNLKPQLFQLVMATKEN